MWFRFARRARRPSAVRSSHFRPQVDVLEDRCLLSAGALDTTFGGTGVVTTSAGKYGGGAEWVLIQPWDGKIVAVGNTQLHRSNVMSLVRYNTDGSLDTTFGSGGTEVSSIGTNGYNAAALYPSTDTTGNAKKIVEAGEPGSLARFNADGSLDTSFGRQGLVSVPWTLTGGVAIQADGKIVVGGNNGNAFALSRYNTNGTLDTSYGSGGTATLAVGPVSPFDMVLQDDGKVVIEGFLEPAGQPRSETTELARFTSEGTLDTTFNSAGSVPGTVTFSFADPGISVELAIYPSTGSDTADDGKIVVAAGIYGNPIPPGRNSGQVALARFNADGTPDTTFGQSGQVVTPLPNSGGWVLATTVQADGKIVAAGRTLVGSSSVLSLLRYNTNGSLDTTFGNGGLVQTSAAPIFSDQMDVAIQSDGRIVATSTVNSEFMVARYLAGPEIGTFTASASTVTSGSSLTLTASNLSDGDPSGTGYATITQVAFYAVDQSGNRVSLGTVYQGNGGAWGLTFMVSLPAGSYTLLAEATDSDGIVGDSEFLPLTVQ
jgi:uncharacterized delta-60 repeat protein